MKLTDENAEIMLFDLLEGNLTAEEANLVMEQINANAKWKKNWELMQLTVLQPDTETVYAHKKDLYKKERGALVSMLWPSFSIAASVALIAGFYWWQLGKDTKQPVAHHIPLKEEIKSSKSELTETKPGHTPKAIFIPIVKAQPYASKALKKGISPLNLTSKNQQIRFNNVKYSPVFVTLAVDSRIIPVANPEMVEPAKPMYATNSDAGLRRLVNRNVDKLIEPFSKPKFTVGKTVKNHNPVILVSVSTAAYTANAELMIKTSR